MTIVPAAGGEETTVKARWLVDASGRSFILKRKLGLLEDNGHVVNSSWFRLAGGLDIEDWADPDDEEFFGRMSERGLRQFSTNHLCGKGYWMWMIPLSSGPISIGIVADPRFHPMDEMDTLDKAIDWIREHEPQLGESIDAPARPGRGLPQGRGLLLRLPSRRSPAATAGAWSVRRARSSIRSTRPGRTSSRSPTRSPPTWSPASSTARTWCERAEAHDDFYLNAYRVHLTQYEGQYVFWDNPIVMNVKISGNNIYYWGCLGLLFFHRKLTDLELMAAVRPDIERMWAIITRLEAMYREWNELEQREWRRAMVPSAAFPAMFDRHRDMIAGLRRRRDQGADARERRPAGGLRGARLQPSGAESRRRRPRRGREDQPVRGQSRSRSLGGRRAARTARASPSPRRGSQTAAGMENLFMEAIAQPA